MQVAAARAEAACWWQPTCSSSSSRRGGRGGGGGAQQHTAARLTYLRLLRQPQQLVCWIKDVGVARSEDDQGFRIVTPLVAERVQRACSGGGSMGARQVQLHEREQSPDAQVQARVLHAHGEPRGCHRRDGAAVAAGRGRRQGGGSNARCRLVSISAALPCHTEPLQHTAPATTHTRTHTHARMQTQRKHKPSAPAGMTAMSPRCRLRLNTSPSTTITTSSTPAEATAAATVSAQSPIPQA
jgi:hypothetical protein